VGSNPIARSMISNTYGHIIALAAFLGNTGVTLALLQPVTAGMCRRVHDSHRAHLIPSIAIAGFVTLARLRSPRAAQYRPPDCPSTVSNSQLPELRQAIPADWPRMIEGKMSDPRGVH
jgi:hypothetical protein